MDPRFTHVWGYVIGTSWTVANLVYKNTGGAIYSTQSSLASWGRGL